MTFDPQLFSSYLTTSDLGSPLYWFESASSTNQILLQKLSEGAQIGTVAIAAQQTSGRGQWGRTWVSPLGGLYLSVAIAPNLPAQQSHRLTLASAWGIASQLRSRNIPVQLKWPNDLYLHDKKLGGILSETSIQKEIIHQAVVGVGLNWQNETLESAIALNHPSLEIHPPINRLEELAALVVNGVADGLRSLTQSQLKEILPNYQQWLYQSLPETLHWDAL